MSERIGSGSGEPTETVDAEAVREFAESFHGTVIRPADEAYEEARKIWNGMIDRRPALIARCSGTADVVAAVGFAREHGLPLAVRGGGHNVAGSAVCDDGLVVDLSEMTGVFVDPAARRARAQGGATIGDVDRETQLFGLAAPLGVVSATGIAGLTLNGGVGHLRRKYGLSLDNLVSAEVVTADGRVRTASEEENPDLFWAIRGGGGNFGVVTSFEYRLHEVGPEVFGLFVWHRGDSEEALRAFRGYAEGASRNASVLPFYAVVPELEEFPEASWGDPAVAFLGCYDGPVAEAEAEFRALREFADPVVDFSGPMAYTDLQSMLDADYPDGLRYYWKAVYVTELTDEVLGLVRRRGAGSPSPLSTVDIWHLGGAIGDVAPDATAFRHREPAFMITFEANWEDPATDDENVAWARDGITELGDLPVSKGAYGNFPGLGEDPARLLFGENYDRVVEVKATYDPENLFRLNQNVAPSA
ncbi:FAD-binding oxidoreductase [Halogeometricum luteum]|uniref:FAD-binding oxidoreductase n=1 Tax=Halogeometricum luteum TaxID=2950537 RepID=A0ABU2G864_9EURY|nr:FAD-binding oxidoreductase [Halogeometricum sp. S3BR5-2]MDS0296449.1 FAD-binding oxidoreductase [Halogeometricum sp. S3BR5-2]